MTELASKRNAVARLTARRVLAVPDGDDRDSAFAALQDRGAATEGMGVDQYASAHRFDDLPSGGRIELQDTAGDDAAVDRIRTHMQQIAEAFASGDFSTPGFVHAMDEVPGTRLMAERREFVQYEYAALPRGAEVRIETADSTALQAIHEFLAFQRLDHRAMGHDMH
jgi:hypothetical protein